MTNKKVTIEISEEELRYIISCGTALSLNVPAKSLPTYCGFDQEQIIEFSQRMRDFANANEIDM